MLGNTFKLCDFFNKHKEIVCYCKNNDRKTYKHKYNYKGYSNDKDSRTKAQKKYYLDPKNKEKIEARWRKQIALKKGLIKKGRCKECGKKEVEGHHFNYNNPIDILWLCKQHHEEIHHYKQIIS
jgi:hypothetical protein